MCGETHGASSRRETSSSPSQPFRPFRGSTIGRSRPPQPSICPGRSTPSPMGPCPPEAGPTGGLASRPPLSTDYSVATARSEKHGLDVYAKKWQTNDEYYANLNKGLDLKPDLVIDDGADLVKLLHTKRRELLDGVRGANEETTTGIIRLRAMERDGALRFPVIDVNDAQMKHLFDNRYGTGQSTFDGLMNATNLL